MSEKVKGYIKNLFVDLKGDVSDIVQASPNSAGATQSILELVSNRITAASQGYMVDLYSELSQKTLNEDIFRDPINRNKFYRLNMRQKINEAYKFDIKNLEAYSSGIDFQEINRVYASAAAAVGSGALSGILLGALSGVIDIPMVVIIAGSVLSGITGGSIAYAKIIPDKNKERYLTSIQSFMADLENELLKWVDEVIEFYNRYVEELKSTL